MRKAFWKKLKSNKRTFKWFYDEYIRESDGFGLAYNTLYQQAKGEMLTTMHAGLKRAIQEYLDGETGETRP